MVILIHTFGSYVVNDSALGSTEWTIANLIDSFCRPSVPLFFMISGALLLKKEYSIQFFFKNRFVRILIPFIFWSIIYSLFNRHFLNDEGFVIGKFIKDIFYGSSIHLWFVYSLCGLYLLVPLLATRLSAFSNVHWRYFLGLWALTLFMSISNFSIYLPKIELTYFSGYLGYFLLGYYLTFKKFTLKLSTLLFVGGVVITFIGTQVISYRSGAFEHGFYNYLTLNVAFSAIGLFNILSDTKINNSTIKKIIVHESKNSYGIYLIHMLILTLLMDFIFESYFQNHLFRLIVIAVMCYMISSIIVNILKRIPVIKSLV